MNNGILLTRQYTKDYNTMYNITILSKVKLLLILTFKLKYTGSHSFNF